MGVPIWIINSALNLVGGQELAWQERKAASFVFTQKYCGYGFRELPPGYAPTVQDPLASPSRITLATAMAISGAAASPNMGYHTSPASAFLMTVFNVRLGWWLGNPRWRTTWMKSSPGNVLISLMSELFGLTSEKGRFIYLSDGGHFENLGIYELVRRRCRFIVACDAEEDHNFSFGGLGNAIERCRADLGIDLEINVEPIRHRSAQRYSGWHCAIGKIHYSRVDPEGVDGILVYLKSSLTGDEPTDVLRYADEHPAFPHESTADQWFNESQFESYRALGYHIVKEVFGADVADSCSRNSTEELFVNVGQRWYPPRAATNDSFTRQTQAVAAIYEQLRSDPTLAFLNEQIYLEWPILLAMTDDADSRKKEDQHTQGPKSWQKCLPRVPAEMRSGFYLCNRVMQVMEDVYLDLKLEDESDHPDNRGWMNFFRHWTWVPMFRVTWTISASNYGARFQTFCERQLNLKIGSTKVEPIPIPPGQEPPAFSKEAKQASSALALTIARWLIRRLPLDALTLTRAIATAADKLAEGPGVAEHEALALAGAMIQDEVDQRIRDDSLPKNPVGEDAEWFAAATLVEMIRRGVADETCRNYAGIVADSVCLHGAYLVQRFPFDEMRKDLNPAERRLIELFFLYNPKLIRSSQIFHFYLVPDFPVPQVNEETSASESLRFPFGFAILDDPTGEPKLVYFRVQDHLRGMGLASNALEKLITDRKDLVAERFEMHPAAHEVPTLDEQRRFERLFDSAKTAVLQQNACNVESNSIV